MRVSRKQLANALLAHAWPIGYLSISSSWLKCIDLANWFQTLCTLQCCGAISINVDESTHNRACNAYIIWPWHTKSKEGPLPNQFDTLHHHTSTLLWITLTKEHREQTEFLQVACLGGNSNGNGEDWFEVAWLKEEQGGDKWAKRKLHYKSCLSILATTFFIWKGWLNLDSHHVNIIFCCEITGNIHCV